MKTIIIKSKDEETWSQVGNKIWDYHDQALEEASDYIEKQEPNSENYYFDVVGLNYFEKFQKPYC